MVDPVELELQVLLLKLTERLLVLLETRPTIEQFEALKARVESLEVALRDNGIYSDEAGA